jgi:F-type H+-transporting ATPase subunit epsilon
MALQFNLVTPEKTLISRPAEMVVVPGKEGDFGVMEGHMPLISSIRPGALEIYEGDRVVESFFISSGFAEANNENLTVLANDAVPVKEIDLAQARQALMALDEKHPDRPHHELALVIAETRVWIAETR